MGVGSGMQIKKASKRTRQYSSTRSKYWSGYKVLARTAPSGTRVRGRKKSRRMTALKAKKLMSSLVQDLSTQSLRKQFNPDPSQNEKFQTQARTRLQTRLHKLNNTFRKIVTENGKIYYFCEYNQTTKWDLALGQTIVQEKEQMPSMKDWLLQEKYKANVLKLNFVARKKR